MFGYIKPCRPELKLKEMDAYRAVYCGLCRQIGASFGCFARLTLSYDFTFYCTLAYSLSETAPRVSMERCCVNPLRRVPMCRSAEDPVLAMGADIAILLIYYKLLDNIQDSKFFLKGTWSLLRPPAAAARRKAAGRRPEMDRVIARMVERQRQLEARDGAGIDEACEPTALALSDICESISDSPQVRRILGRMGYFLGRYIYLCDALDDLEEDRRKGSYNPFLSVSSSSDPVEAAKGSLFMTVGEVGRAYNLLEPGSFRPVLDNVIYLGLAAGVEEIIAKKEKRK